MVFFPVATSDNTLKDYDHNINLQALIQLKLKLTKQ